MTDLCIESLKNGLSLYTCSKMFSMLRALWCEVTARIGLVEDSVNME